MSTPIENPHNSHGKRSNNSKCSNKQGWVRRSSHLYVNDPYTLWTHVFVYIVYEIDLFRLVSRVASPRNSPTTLSTADNALWRLHLIKYPNLAIVPLIDDLTVKAHRSIVETNFIDIFFKSLSRSLPRTLDLWVVLHVRFDIKLNIGFIDNSGFLTGIYFCYYIFFQALYHVLYC